MSSDQSMSPVKRRVLLGALANWLAFAFNLVVGFFLTPYLVRGLGDGPYGVWQVVEGVLAYFTLFDLGIASSVERYVARYQATDRKDDLGRLTSTCFALFGGLASIGFLVGAVSLWAVLGSVEAPGVPADELRAFAILMLGTLAITMPLGVFSAALDGAQLFVAKSGVRVIALALRAIGAIVVLRQSPSLLHIGYVFAGVTVIEFLLFAVLAWRLVPGLRVSWALVDRETIRMVRGYSAYSFLAMVAGRISVQSGGIIVGAFSGAEAVTFYSLAARLVEFAKAITRTATNTLTPAISALDAAGHVAAIRKVMLHGTRWSLYLIMPVHAGLVIFGQPFLQTWLGNVLYAERSYPALVILSATLSLVVAQSVAARILYGTARLKWFSRMALLESLVNVTLGIVLCSLMGSIGVAIGVAIPNLLMCTWVIVYTLRSLEMSKREYLAAAILRPVSAMAIPVGVWLAWPWTTLGWLPLGLALGTGLAPYGVAVLALEKRLSIANLVAVGRRLRGR